MARKYFLIILVIFLSCNYAVLSQKLLAVPDAVGFGKFTRGAYAGSIQPEILIVDTLCDASVSTGNNRGSLRWALTRNFPRIVVFEISGYIHLQSKLEIRNAFITIYGQTAPASGITIRNEMFIVRANEVIIQHVKFRYGKHVENEDSFAIWGGENAYIDHCSFSWGPDENASISGEARGQISIVNCLFSEGLDDHNMGFLGYAGDNISFIYNAFIHCAQRQPLINAETWTTVEVINNLNYNPYYHQIQFAGGSNSPRANIVGNVLKAGPSTQSINKNVMVIRGELNHNAKFYVANNYSSQNPNGLGWDLVGYSGGATPDSNYWKLDEPTFWDNSLKVIQARELESFLISNVGAFYWERGEIDKRVINDLINGTGKLISSISEVGGFPEIIVKRHSLEIPKNPHNDDNDNGYSNIEDWVSNLHAGIDGCIGLAISADIKKSDPELSNGAISVYAVGGNPSYSFLWEDNTTSPFRSDLSVGKYAVVVTDSKGCTASDSWNVSESEEAAEESLIKIFPNPASEFITVHVEKEGIMKIYNLYGKKVLDRKLNGHQEQVSIDLDPGQYIVKIEIGGGKFFTQKIIVVR